MQDTWETLKRSDLHEMMERQTRHDFIKRSTQHQLNTDTVFGFKGKVHPIMSSFIYA